MKANGTLLRHIDTSSPKQLILVLDSRELRDHRRNAIQFGAPTIERIDDLSIEVIEEIFTYYDLSCKNQVWSLAKHLICLTRIPLFSPVSDSASQFWVDNYITHSHLRPVCLQTDPALLIFTHFKAAHITRSFMTTDCLYKLPHPRPDLPFYNTHISDNFTAFLYYLRSSQVSHQNQSQYPGQPCAKFRLRPFLGSWPLRNLALRS